MFSSLLYVSSFILGIAGSLHCLGMCGPLVLAVPVKQGKGRTSKMLIYLLSKAFAYASIGAAVGLLGLGLFLLKWQQWLSILSGIFIILFVLVPYMHKISGNYPFKNLFGKLIRSMQKDPRWYHYASLGYLNGFLPCGLVYAALTTALVAGSIWGGALAMFTFGLGTLPSLLILAVFKMKLNSKWQSKLKPISIGLSILVGCLLILRGMNLGIPYISPHLTADGQVEACCH